MLGQGMPQRLGERMPQAIGTGEIGGCRLLDDCPVLENRHPVRHAQRQIDIMRDQKDAAARIGKRSEIIERTYREIQVEPRRRLVGDDQARVIHQRTAQKHPASHPSGQLMRVALRGVGVQTVTLEQLDAATLAHRALLARRKTFDLPPDAHHGIKA